MARCVLWPFIHLHAHALHPSAPPSLSTTTTTQGAPPPAVSGLGKVSHPTPMTSLAAVKDRWVGITVRITVEITRCQPQCVVCGSRSEKGAVRRRERILCDALCTCDLLRQCLDEIVPAAADTTLSSPGLASCPGVQGWPSRV